MVSILPLMKTLCLLTGCNGAGKTTAAYALLPDLLACCEFVNADEIARGRTRQGRLAAGGERNRRTITHAGCLKKRP